MLRHTIGRHLAALLTMVALAAGCATAATAASKVAPLKFITPFGHVGGLHATSGLPGFPARDYLAPGGALVRAPFTGCVPSWRPWGRLSYQNPSAGFGGSRIYLQRTKTGDTAYLAHFELPGHPYGYLFLKPGQCFRQGDPVGIVWHWPNNPGRSHIHTGYEGGDPLYELVNTDGTFRIVEGPVWQPGPDGKVFPRPILRHEGQWWRVQVGQKRVYQGGETKARQVYKTQKLARRLNLHFRAYDRQSPLIGWGLVIVRQFRARDIDPRLGAAIGTCETSAGTKGDGPAVNNDFGLLVWNPDQQRTENRRFKSRKQAIRYLAQLLQQKYIAKGADTLVEIARKYAPDGASNDPAGLNRHWLNCVARWYKHLGGTRYLQPHPNAKPETVELPKLTKVTVYTALGKAEEPGYWRCTRAGETLFQGQYRPAKTFCDAKRAYWQRKAA